jgi:hypothetical protein
MALYRRGNVWWANFVLSGETHQFSTKLKNKRDAKDYADTVRVAMVKGEVGILERKTIPTLADFLKKSFIPHCETKHKEKFNTLRYYKAGAADLTASPACRVADIRNYRRARDTVCETAGESLTVNHQLRIAHTSPRD